ncbi:hypothetical protein DFR56_102183 [Pseudogracilibacillus auburnensis]|uniref:Uncharacterized protein n=1 Tax=Pseudogracilibacillus auburnensis TaxID=1494959 RepID=A0A2V3W738_9BACI|nr:hypothetical protein DFR56_102183 [Pseudogracilibacillus auburnensis]
MSEIKDEIILRGLKENNLKNIDVNIPKEKITVFTGLPAQERARLFLIR